jgi:TPR repeat protein
VKQDFVEAARWYRKAANQGNADALNNLGIAFFQGQGVKRDFGVAARWWHKAPRKALRWRKKSYGSSVMQHQPPASLPRHVPAPTAASRRQRAASL